MSKVSKTARASAGMMHTEKKVIPDEVYIKNLRNDLDSGLYVAQEGARTLLRAYDAALAKLTEMTDSLKIAAAENHAIQESEQALKAQVAELEAEITQIKSVVNG